MLTSAWAPQQTSFVLIDGSRGYAGTYSNIPFVLQTNSATRFTLDTAGDAGIATTTPFGRLSVTGAGTGTGYTFLVADSNKKPLFKIQDNGGVGIGTTSPTTALQVNGVITPSADNTSSLGNATYRWSAVYSANGTISNIG